MSQYLLSVWHEDTYEHTDEVDVESPDNQRTVRAGRRVQRGDAGKPASGCSAAGCSLPSPPPWSALADGEVSMTDGPYAESKEQMGGFWIIEAADLDAALDWASGRRRRARDRSRFARSRVNDDLDAVFRREAGRCTATLIRVLGDIDLAEDAVAEAFAIAAERWPTEGMPPNPGGWITTTARNRAIDRLRRESTRTDRYVAAHRLHDDDDMAPDDAPSSTTSTPSSTSSPTTSCD